MSPKWVLNGTTRVESQVFVIMGVMAAISGVIFTAYMNQAMPQAGNMFELDATSAVFIGGASATGGVGTIIGSVIGDRWLGHGCDQQRHVTHEHGGGVPIGG